MGKTGLSRMIHTQQGKERRCITHDANISFIHKSPTGLKMVLTSMYPKQSLLSMEPWAAAKIALS